MNTDKVLALADKADLIYVANDGEAYSNWEENANLTEPIIKFAALLQQQMIEDGWRSPENKYDEPCDLIPTIKERK